MPPVSTVAVTTSRPYVSLSHGTQNDVSRPPENARMIGVWSLLTSMLPGWRASARDDAFEPGGEDLLVIGGVGGHEHGIVATDVAHDLGPRGAIEREGNALRGADRGTQNEQVR